MTETGTAQGGAAERLATLVQLERLARRCDGFESFGFFAVNETIRLFPYDRAVFGYENGGHVRIAAVSGLAAVEEDTAFVRWMKRAVRERMQKPEGNEAAVLRASDMSPGMAAEWDAFNTETVLWAPFVHPVSRRIIGGLWLSRTLPFSDREVQAAGLLAESYAALCALWKPGKTTAERRSGRRRKTVVTAAVCLAAFFPVRTSVLAPAEITAAEPRFVTAPMNGIIEGFDVAPGERVVRGAPLFRFESDTLRNQALLADKAVSTAMAEYRKAAQSAFSSPQNKARLPLIQLEIEKARAEASHVRERLERAVVRAPADGVAVFADAADWIGRPAAVGERILTLADPAKTALKIDVPVQDAFDLQKGNAVRFYRNGTAFSPVEGRLEAVAFEPETSPEGFLAYRARASVDAGEKLPRIGTRGVARIYGERTPFVFHALRRPLAWMRQRLGI